VGLLWATDIAVGTAPCAVRLRGAMTAIAAGEDLLSLI
jgi:hypothetical protein